jgi:hypothetical protein
MSTIEPSTNGAQSWLVIHAGAACRTGERWERSVVEAY